MTSQSRFFLNKEMFSGKNPARKGCFMKFSRGALAAALASVVMTVAPSLAQSFRPVSNVLPEPKDPIVTLPKEAPEKSVLREARAHSLAHEEVAIAIAKGKKDNITGEQIGETLAAILKKNFGITAKYFVEEGGDYTAVAFYVAGYGVGGYGLKESVTGAALAAGHWDDVFGSGRRRDAASGVLGKPAPER